MNKPINNSELVTAQDSLPASAAEINQMSPLQQMQQAHVMGMTVAEMKDMLVLQKDYEANEARKAFHIALAEFKKNPPQIFKDRINDKYGSGYVSIGNMVSTVNEAMGPFGLTSRWEFPAYPAETINVTCILSHSMGHEEKVTLSGMPDTAGSKNPLQEAKSTRTYLKLETFEAATGMASIHANMDDDGNSSGNVAAPKIEVINESQVKAINGKIDDHKLDKAIFVKWLSKKIPYTKGSTNLIPTEHYDMVSAKLDESIKNKSEK